MNITRLAHQPLPVLRHHPLPGGQPSKPAIQPLVPKPVKKAKAPRVRKSILEIQTAWENGDHQELEDLMLAWKGVKEKRPDDEQSFFQLGGFHGAPFRGPGTTDTTYWGGYCQHGNVLFPVWHRAYLLALEDSLRTIKPNVTLPYLDQGDDHSMTRGIPWCLTDRTFTFANKTVIPNPLFSFVVPVAIVDQTTGAGASHSKPVGYETKRYPLAGLVGTPEDKAKTDEHNSRFKDDTVNERHLNANYVDFVNDTVVINGKPFNAGTYEDYVNGLDVPNYTPYSNTTSASDYNQKKGDTAVSLESPHNLMHLAIGGAGALSPIAGASGDMGENDVAGLDPIFYFHHCFVDYAFWQWQKKNNATKPGAPALTIDYTLKGTNTSDHPQTQGPAAGLEKDKPLTFDTPLIPFKKPGTNTYYTGRECIDIFAEPMLYDYDKGSLASQVAKTDSFSKSFAEGGKIIDVKGIDRSKIPGSFVIVVFVSDGHGGQVKIGSHAVLNRWNTQGCMNCQASLEASAQFVLPAGVDESSVGVNVTGHDFIFTSTTKGQHPPAPARPGFEKFVFSIHPRGAKF